MSSPVSRFALRLGVTRAKMQIPRSTRDDGQVQRQGTDLSRPDYGFPSQVGGNGTREKRLCKSSVFLVRPHAANAHAYSQIWGAYDCERLWDRYLFAEALPMYCSISCRPDIAVRTATSQ